MTVRLVGEMIHKSTEKLFMIGDIVLAKSAEDKVWYRALITELAAVSCIVSSSMVPLCDVVSQTSAIPETDEVDENVYIDIGISTVPNQKGKESECKSSTPKEKLSFEDPVYAKWDDNQIVTRQEDFPDFGVCDRGTG